VISLLRFGSAIAKVCHSKGSLKFTPKISPENFLFSRRNDLSQKFFQDITQSSFHLCCFLFFLSVLREQAVVVLLFYY